MRSLLVSTPHVALFEDASLGIAWLIRRPTVGASSADVVGCYGRCLEGAEARHASMGLVVDVRNTTLREDRVFRQGMVQVRARAQSAFARVAVLVATPRGAKAAHRVRQEDESEDFVTYDPVEAERWASGEYVRTGPRHPKGPG
ncbi:MAG: hypothetical protein AAF447_22735 [Myxococcota bacterium]